MVGTDIQEIKLEMTQEVNNALNILFEQDQVIEVRCLGNYNNFSGYFTDHEKIASQVFQHDTDRGIHGIYVVLNEINPSLFARRANRIAKLGKSDSTTGDSDIVRRKWLPVDIDAKRPSGISSSEKEHEAAIEKAKNVAKWLSELGFPEPIVGDSGNGAHLLYRIDLDTSDESRDLVKRGLEALSMLHSDEICVIDTTVFNASRIWKLYGTMARKGDHIPERPHRRAKLISTPSAVECVSEASLKSLAALLPAAEYETIRQSDSLTTTASRSGMK